MNFSALLALASPLDLSGPDFLKLYWILAAIALVGGILLRRFYALQAQARADGSEPSPYEVACLAGPPARAVHAAIAQLAQDGLISVDGRSGAVSFVNPGEVAGRPPIEQSVLRAVAGKSGVALASVEAACAPELADLQSSLHAKGLLVAADRAKQAWLIPTLFIAVIQILALIRICVGFSRGKPIAFLVLSLIVFGVLSSVLLRRPYRTSRGDQVLNGLKARYRDLQREAAAAGSTGLPSPGLASFALPMAVGVLGYSVLAGTSADGMYQRMRSTGSDGFSSTSSDSSSDSGGGDSGDSGDGGGGGGCGGCGGGGGD